MHVEGTVLVGREFEPVEGRVVVADGEIVAIEETDTESDDVVIPAFVNAHTHVGDSIAKEAGGGLTLDELVAPPDGLKHRLLRATDREVMVRAMARSIRFMAATGTGAFLEFREGGVDGVEALRDALADDALADDELADDELADDELVDDALADGAANGRGIEAVVLGRGEADVLDVADGYGASGSRDADFDAKRTATREAGKLFGIHAGERDALDVNSALDLDPDFLVHMVHAEPLHLRRVEDRGTPVVVCPRSNLVTNVGVPPIRELNDRTTVALGTDNVMLNSPSMFREMEFTSKLADVPAAEVLRMATVNGAAIANLNCGVIEEGRDAKLLVLDGDSDNLSGSRDLVRAIVRRAGQGDVKDVLV